MGRFPSVLLFLILSAAVSSAAAQDYWKKVLPNTPVPGAVLDLLRPGWLSLISRVSVFVCSWVVAFCMEEDAVCNLHSFLQLSAAVSSAAAQDYWKKVLPNTPLGGAHVPIRKGTDTSLNARVPPRWFLYGADTQTVALRDPNTVIFFHEEDLHRGSKMKLHLGRSTPAAAFAPRAFADAMPFSTKDLPEILARFSLKPNSKEEAVLRSTLQLCEARPAVGETNHCATSLESMVDFVTSKLGTSVRAVSMVGKRAANKPQNYTVVSVGQSLTALGDKSVSCHELAYPYAVFYCHATPASTTANIVPLVGEDGDKVAAVAVCHHDTSAWNPGHIAFQMLKVKPGTATICHFMPQDNVFWATSGRAFA
ncbi:hypothetical protein Taro_050294 [Colocasia esculenta]|uniref:BURP domain-containing protein n=1 Tax=Colocasia esculenta TaxID=4460 RepID=A0A843XDH2_COLES|nr:hypothetical protein [Colocasia esculenta]